MFFFPLGKDILDRDRWVEFEVGFLFNNFRLGVVHVCQVLVQLLGINLLNSKHTRSLSGLGIVCVGPNLVVETDKVEESVECVVLGFEGGLDIGFAGPGK